MKLKMKFLASSVAVIFVFSILIPLTAFAATVGQPLTSPESGWKRYDDTAPQFKYVGAWSLNDSDTDIVNYNGTYHQTLDQGAKISFDFVGQKIRIITPTNAHYSQDIEVNIDNNIHESFSEFSSTAKNQILVYEKSELEWKRHTVEIIVKTLTSTFDAGFFDAIDIDEEGQLLLPSPTNLSAIAGDVQVDLSWDADAGANNYNIKRSTTSGGPYTLLASSVTDVAYSDLTVVNGTTYYYVVTAVYDEGESGNSNEISATPQAPEVGRALLDITLSNGLQKEYDLSMTEVNTFIDWYNDRAGGAGLAIYPIEKTDNHGPFTSRKDYIVFDKIEMFEVNEYTPNE